MNYDPYGTWEVSTEGDCEGRSIRRLGTFTGYIDEIAFALARQSGYTLEFKRVGKTDEFDRTPTANKVNIRIWEMGDNVSHYEQMLKDREVFVKRGQYYKSVELHLENPLSKEEMEAMKAKKILFKHGFDVDAIKEFL